MKDNLLKRLNKQSLIEIIRKKEIIIDKALERLTLKRDIQEKDVIEVFANAIKDTLNILKGEDNNEKTN